jgi:hypothetical protein
MAPHEHCFCVPIALEGGGAYRCCKSGCKKTLVPPR